MQIVKGKNEQGQEVEINLDNVKYFGTEIEHTKDKKGNFKSFHTHTWVKEGGQKVYIEDMKIGGLKKYFNNYNSDKRYHTEEKNGKVKKATEWLCEVVEEGTINLHQEDARMIKQANDKRRMFVYKNIEYFFILPNLFRSNNDGKYYYFDEELHRLISLGYTVTDYPTKEQLLNRINEYKEK